MSLKVPVLCFVVFLAIGFMLCYRMAASGPATYDPSSPYYQIPGTNLDPLLVLGCFVISGVAFVLILVRLVGNLFQ